MTLSKKANEGKNKQIHSQIKIHYKHLKNITKINKYKKTEQHIYDAVQNRKQLHFGGASKSEPLFYIVNHELIVELFTSFSLI